MQGAERRLLYFLDLLGTQINTVSVPSTTWNHNPVPGLVFKLHERRVDTLTHCKQLEVSVFGITVTGWKITSNLCLIQQKFPVSGSAQILFLFESSVIHPTDFGQFSSNEKMWRVKEKTWQWEIFHNSYEHQAVLMSQHPGSLLCPSVPCTAVQSYTHTDVYRQTSCTYKMYKEAESDLAVKFPYISSQYKTQSWFFFISFLKSPEHQSSHPKPRARANSGAALSSTAGNLNIHGKQAKNCRKRK